jgi:hypothetical protein
MSQCHIHPLEVGPKWQHWIVHLKSIARFEQENPEQHMPGNTIESDIVVSVALPFNDKMSIGPQ